MKLILEKIQQSEAVLALEQRRQGLAALSLNQEALIIGAYFNRTQQPTVVVKGSLYEAQQLYQKVSSIVSETTLFQVEESLRMEAIAASPEVKAERIAVLHRLLSEPLLVITHTAALMRHLPNPTLFQQQSITLRVGQQLSMDDLKQQLIQSGYEMVAKVDRPLTFAIRGGVVDVFSMNNNQPIRIEFFDIEIDSIRFFDVNQQQSSQHVNEVTIVPASDILFSEKDIEVIEAEINKRLRQDRDKDGFLELEQVVNQELEYIKHHVSDNGLYKYYGVLPQSYHLLNYMENPLVIISTSEEIKRQEQQIVNETVEYFQELYQQHKSLRIFQVFQPVDNVLTQQDVYQIQQFVLLEQLVEIGITPNENIKQHLDVIIQKMVKEAQTKVVLVCLSTTYLKQFVTTLIQRQIPYKVVSEESELTVGISVINSQNSIAFEYQDWVVYTDQELYDNVVKKTRHTNKFLQSKVVNDYQELNKGDYVVHNLYGIGQYVGIITREINGLTKDFLKIIYKGNDELLVPLEQFGLVRKFVSSDGVRPKLNKLGTTDWQKTKDRIKSSVKDIAQRLVKLYSAREKAIGFAFSPDGKLQEEFESEFEFELTADQKVSIMEIKADMESKKPMDRLLCGDVGFGKTEVAMRAAFKAIVDQKQVAFLCPTTILSRQHYQTFLNRFINFPVRIAVLNRFVLPSQQKEIIADIKKGLYDIVIGTHRILSKDVQFKDLGLLIIDEEQRFGVEHKERIKELKHSIDVLSLSATPIPRTLQMSLIGVRSLSQLNTPPVHRLPVQTYVVEKSFSLIKNIIQRELARDGQVFYLYNNIDDIYNVAMKLSMAIEGINVGVAHGKMSREEIEDVMVRFTQNEYQVLVCTTIIETGIDIPNANTIIIDQADRFGLSQLYQIRGRVGRSDRLGYAYLMYTPSKQLSEIATKRLKAIKEFTELGSGYKIAMRDLTIRGAGDLLGGSQSGFIDTVGIDMYIELLHEAIQEEKGEVVEKTSTPKRIPMDINAYIPSKFTEYDDDKLSLYQKIDKIKSIEALTAEQERVIDYYGKIPKAVALLFEKKRLEIMISNPMIDSFKEQNQKVVLTFTEEWSSQIDGVALFELINSISKDIKIKYLKGKIIIEIMKTAEWLQQTTQVLTATTQLARRTE